MPSHYAELASLYRLRIIICAVIAALIALAFSLFMLKTSPSYSASVTMNMQPAEEALLFNREFMGRSQFNPATIITQTHIERLLSKPVAERAIETLLARNAGNPIPVTEPGLPSRLKGWLWRTWTRLNFGGFVPAPEELQLLNEFRESVDVETVEGSYILIIKASHEFPTVAAQIANVLAETYITIASEESALASENAAFVLREQVETLEAQLAALFDQRTALRSEYDISDLGRQAGLLLTSIESVQGQLSNELLERGLKERELQRLTAELGTGSSRSQGPIQNLEDEIEVLNDRIAFRQSQIAEQSANLSLLSSRETDFANINIEIDAARQSLATVRERLSTFELGARSQAGQVQIIAPATVPLYPSSPKVLVNTIVAFIVGALIVFMTAVVQDIFGARLRTSSDLVAAVGDRALPSGSKQMLGHSGAFFWRRYRNKLKRRSFVEAFGQKMSVDTNWKGAGIAVTGYVDQKKLIEVRNFLGEIVSQSVHRPGNRDAFRVTAIGPLHSVKDWDSLEDLTVVVVCEPDQKFDYDVAGLTSVGTDPVRHPLFMIWRG